MRQALDKNGLTEAEFLRRYDPDKYPKPSLTADMVIFRERPGADTPEVLLVRRGGHPYLGYWALPGGFANPEEPFDQTAVRELMEETGMSGGEVTLVGVYSGPGRDPRGWVVSAAFAAVVTGGEAIAADDAAAVLWAPLEKDRELPWRLSPCDPALEPDERNMRLAFDHDRILADAIRVVYGGR